MEPQSGERSKVTQNLTKVLPWKQAVRYKDTVWDLEEGILSDLEIDVLH